MEYFLILISVVSLALLIHFATALRNVKKQISEISEALADIRDGNGNRRILAPPRELVAPLAYEINEIILSYEDRLSLLRRAQEANRQLMTSLSHDIRTPLTTLIGYLDAACKGLVTGREREDYVEIARRKSYELKDHIDTLFDWFKLNSDEFVLKTDTLEMAELTRNILADWIPVFEDRRIEYAVSIPEKPFFTRLDRDGYTRILNNLIQNVIVHSQADQMEISIGESGDSVRLQLRDNGIGIKTEDLEHIFERLYRCNTRYSSKGSGLGLSIACQLARKMGGTISAESTPGNGTVFILLFPFAEK